MGHTYRNSFFNEHNPVYGPEFYETDASPTAYRGAQIFHRHANCYDIVVNDVCVAQCAGPNGARRRIDVMADKETTLRDLAIAAGDGSYDDAAAARAESHIPSDSEEAR